MNRSIKKIVTIFTFVFFIFPFHQNVTAQSIVSGNVFGTWTTGNSYWVTGDITVPKDSSLIIEKGVEISFIGTYTLIVDGLLQANGSAENMITFKGQGGAWDKIYFSEGVDEGCHLNYCNIMDAGWDSLGSIYIFNNDSNVTISNCNISYSKSFGIYIKSYIFTNDGDSIIKECNPKILNNLIFNNKADGIYIHTNYEKIYWGRSSNHNICISSPLIRQNIIYQNDGNGIKAFTYAYSSGNTYDSIIITNPRILKNTIFNNTANGIQCDKWQSYTNNPFVRTTVESNSFISSNIISNNGLYGLRSNNFVEIGNVKHNDFWNNSLACLDFIGSGFGENVRTNLNGDSCDIHLNIFYNPKFIDENNFDFHLFKTSKCIDAGDLNLSFDPDETFPDIGAYYFDQSQTDILEHLNKIEKFSIFQNYPNPFNPTTTINFSLAEASNVEFKIYNINGQELVTLIREQRPAGYYSVIWNGKNSFGQSLPSGLYIYSIKVGNFVKTHKMMMVK